ncbi:single-stranded DNA-binding protein [Treponema primitia]|jgi:single-strand DNA-binding protein|uniref:single-stranded DNA-binding protein n=1 Tax=Treponema primitia TaxID=88058 RepID=UPI0002554D15|nr:single-stranded DNA-binding protein [Treponema primitia]
MNNLNSVIVEGNLVRDPLYKTTQRGVPLCTFSIASNRFFKKDSKLEKEISYFDVEAWSKLAESCFRLGHKGRGARVVGRLKQDRWDGSDGKPRTKISIVAEHVEFRPEFVKDASAETPEYETTDEPGTPEPVFDFEPTF